jgi:hypothetical protein
MVGRSENGRDSGLAAIAIPGEKSPCNEECTEVARAWRSPPGARHCCDCDRADAMVRGAGRLRTLADQTNVRVADLSGQSLPVIRAG